MGCRERQGVVGGGASQTWVRNQRFLWREKERKGECKQAHFLHTGLHHSHPGGPLKEGCACACLHRSLQLLRGELWPSPDLGLEAREVGRCKSREGPGPTAATGARGCSEQTGWGAGVRGPSRDVACGGLPLQAQRLRRASLGKGPGGGLSLLGGATCCLLPLPALEAPGGAGRRPFPWTQAGCRGQLAVLASFYLPLQNLLPGKQQASPALVSLSFCTPLKDRQVPSSPWERAVLPNECGVTHTQGAVCMFQTCVETNRDPGTNVSNLGNVHALGRSYLH